MKQYWKPAMAALCMASVPCMPVHAQGAISFAVGDEWVFHQVVDAPGKPAFRAAPRFQIPYANKQGQLLMSVTESEPVGGARQLRRIVYQLDPSACFVDITSGEPLRTERHCELPEPGKSWEYSTVDSVAKVEDRYAVLGRELVRVGEAGYDAIKVEVTRTRSEVAYPGVDAAPPERTHTLYWFAPTAKVAVKVVRERFDASGARKSVQTDELQRFANVKSPK